MVVEDVHLRHVRGRAHVREQAIDVDGPNFREADPRVAVGECRENAECGVLVAAAQRANPDVRRDVEL